MKKVILSVVFFAAIVVSAHAQRFAYVDTKYILEKLSDYKGAQPKRAHPKWERHPAPD